MYGAQGAALMIARVKLWLSHPRLNRASSGSMFACSMRRLV